MVTAVRFWKNFIDFSSAKYARSVPPLVFSESMELHHITLRFKLVVVRLVTEGNALAVELLNPLMVNLNAGTVALSQKILPTRL